MILMLVAVIAVGSLLLSGLNDSLTFELPVKTLLVKKQCAAVKMVRELTSVPVQKESPSVVSDTTLGNWLVESK